MGLTLANALPTWLGGSAVTPDQLAARQQAAAAQITAVGASPGAQVNTGVTPDTALVNGKAYTFVFATDGTATTSDIITSALADSFLAMQGVSALVNGANVTVTFTYEGDGSDLVSDYANAITAAVVSETQGNGPILSYLSGTDNTQAVSTLLRPVVMQQVAASNADQAQVATQANAAAAASDNALLSGGLTGIILLVAVVGAGIFFLAPSLLKSPKVSVG